MKTVLRLYRYNSDERGSKKHENFDIEPSYRQLNYRKKEIKLIYSPKVFICTCCFEIFFAISFLKNIPKIS